MDLSSRPTAPNPYDLLPSVPTFTVSSDDFEDGAAIPLAFAGSGDNVSPSLSWSGFPPETKSFMVSAFDPDAPTPAGFWHWTVINIPVNVTELKAGAGASDSALPGGAFHLQNDLATLRYYGPNPPSGDRAHRYVFAVHALNVETLQLTSDDTPTKGAFTALFHTIARATVTGTFQQ